jgi:hypothetical protein
MIIESNYNETADNSFVDVAVFFLKSLPWTVG